MKKIRDNASGAPGGYWPWKCPETKHVLRHGNYSGLRKIVLEYLRANNFPITTNFDDDFEQNICEQLPNACIDWEPPTIFEKMNNFAAALYRLATKDPKKPLVTAEELERRRGICVECNFYGGSTSPLKVSCKSCGCGGLKQYLRTSRCPLNPPKW